MNTRTSPYLNRFQEPTLRQPVNDMRFQPQERPRNSILDKIRQMTEENKLQTTTQKKAQYKPSHRNELFQSVKQSKNEQKDSEAAFNNSQMNMFSFGLNDRPNKAVVPEEENPLNQSAMISFRPKENNSDSISKAYERLKKRPAYQIKEEHKLTKMDFLEDKEKDDKKFNKHEIRNLGSNKTDSFIARLGLTLV